MLVIHSKNVNTLNCIFSSLLLFLIALNCSLFNSTNSPKRVQKKVDFYLKLAADDQIKHEKRLLFNEKAIALLLERENDSMVREGIYSAARIYYDLNCMEDYKRTVLIGLARSNYQTDKNHLALAFYYLGNYYRNLNKNDSAFYFYLKAERIFLRALNKKLLAQLYLNKSTVQIGVFDIFGAEISAVKSLKYFREMGDKLGEYDALINLGISSNSAEDYIKSNLYYK